MKRIIEELIEKRKQRHKTFQDTLADIGRIIDAPGGFRTKKKPLRDRLEQLDRDLRDWMTAQDKEWDAYASNHAGDVFRSLQWRIDKLEAEYSHVRTLLTHFLDIERSLSRLIEEIDRRVPEQAAAGLREARSRLSVFQYADFERRFRGDENAVRKQLKPYLPLFAEADDILDLGCGRGEFLGMLAENGKRAEGVDASDSMLKQAEERGLACVHGDILEYLRARGDASAGGVFSSQVIEHFPPDYLRDVVCECARVLKPGAPIVLETINPLSLHALSRIFFLDVTHQKPLHPEYMRFLLERANFTKVDIRYSRLPGPGPLEAIAPEHDFSRTFNENVDRLNEILFAPAMYAVTGIKPPPA